MRRDHLLVLPRLCTLLRRAYGLSADVQPETRLESWGQYGQPDKVGMATTLADGTRLTTAKCECMQSWGYAGQTTSDYCMNPDGDANGEWCFTTDAAKARAEW